MALSYDLSKIENFETLCHDTMTEAEAEEAGTTFEKLLKETIFFGPGWSELEGISELEVLAGKERKLVRMSMVTHSLIFATMALGLGEIVEATEVEFYARLATLRKLRGCWLSVVEDGESVPRPITFAEVQVHRGLTTNSPNIGWAEWSRKVLEDTRRSVMEDDKVEDIRLPPWLAPVSVHVEDALSVIERLGKGLQSPEYESEEVQTRAEKLSSRHLGQVYRWAHALEEMHQKWFELDERNEEWIDAMDVLVEEE